MDYNPQLKPWHRPQPNTSAGKGYIEAPGKSENMVWQTRSASPSSYELGLADALVTVFGEGISELDGVVARLNELGVQSPEGKSWTTVRFEAEMARLGY